MDVFFGGESESRISWVGPLFPKDVFPKAYNICIYIYRGSKHGIYITSTSGIRPLHGLTSTSPYFGWSWMSIHWKRHFTFEIGGWNSGIPQGFDPGTWNYLSRLKPPSTLWNLTHLLVDTKNDSLEDVSPFDIFWHQFCISRWNDHPGTTQNMRLEITIPEMNGKLFLKASGFNTFGHLKKYKMMLESSIYTAFPSMYL